VLRWHLLLWIVSTTLLYSEPWARYWKNPGEFPSTLRVKEKTSNWVFAAPAPPPMLTGVSAPKL
jgi:hypothetical protein